MSVSDTVRDSATQLVFEDYPVLGYNYRLTDIQAAVGCIQMARLPEILGRRRELATRYLTALDAHPGPTLSIIMSSKLTTTYENGSLQEGYRFVTG